MPTEEELEQIKKSLNDKIAFHPQIIQAFESLEGQIKNENIKTIIEKIESVRNTINEKILKIQNIIQNTYIEPVNITRISDAISEAQTIISKTIAILKNEIEPNSFWEIFEEYIEGSGEELKCKNFTFPNTDWQKIEIPQEGIFIDCKFLGSINFSSEKNKKIEKCIFQGCSFDEQTNFEEIETENFLITNCLIRNEITFKNVNFTKTAEIYQITALNNNAINKITFKNCKNNNKLKLNQIKTRQLDINNENQNMSMEAKESDIERININSRAEIGILLQETRTTHLAIDRGIIKLEVYKHNGTLKLIVAENDNVSFKLINLKKTKIEDCAIYAKKIESINLENLTIENSIIIESNSINKIKLDEIIISGYMSIKDNMKEVDSNKNEKSKLEISNSEITKDATLQISNKHEKQYDTILFLEIGNYGLFKIVNANTDKLRIKDSVMNQAQMHRITITEEAEIENSSIAKIGFFNVKWCSIENINAGQEEFRQLKYAYEDQKNMIEAAKFYAKELSIYHEEIKQNKKTKKDHEDIIMLTASKLLSDHGLSWAKPLIWMILIAIIGIHTSTIFLVNTQHLMGAILSVMVISGWFGIIFDSLNNNVKIKETILISFFFSAIVLWVYLLGFRQIDIAMNFINPFSTDFKTIYDECQEMGKWEKIIMFLIWILYKTFFILTSYHMIVALKRITKF